MFVCGLVDDTIPGETSVVDDDVNFTIAEFGGLLHQFVDGAVEEDITGDGNGIAAGLVDFAGYFGGFVCWRCEIFRRTFRS